MCAKFWILIYLSHQILIFYIIAPPTLKFPDLCWISTIDLTNFGSPELVCKMLNFQIGLSRQIYLAYQMLSLYIRPAKSWIPNKIGSIRYWRSRFGLHFCNYYFSALIFQIIFSSASTHGISARMQHIRYTVSFVCSTDETDVSLGNNPEERGVGGWWLPHEMVIVGLMV